MTQGPNRLNRIAITIEANNVQVAKKVLHGSLLNQHDINKLFNLFFSQNFIKQDIYLESLTLNLGEINSHNFNLLFRKRLNAALSKALNKYKINNQHKNILSEIPISQKTTDNISLLHSNHLADAENFIHYLNQKDSRLNPMEAIANIKNINIKQLINQLSGLKDKWIPLLAKSCLSEQSLQRLLALKQPDLLNAINLKLSEKVNHLQYQEKQVPLGGLILNALKYIQRHNIKEIPKPNEKIISRITTELNNGGLNSASVIRLFRQSMIHNTALNSWLKQLWQTVSVSRLCQNHLSVEEYQYLLEYFMPNRSDKNISNKESIITHVDILNIRKYQNLPAYFTSNNTGKNKSDAESAINSIDFSNVQQYQRPTNQKIIAKDRQASSTSDNTSVTGRNSHNPLRTINRPHYERVLLSEQPLQYQVNNAGILILWPTLPTLFNQLGLLEAQKFIHRQAQFSAVDFLDYLIWGNEEKQVERKALNYVLCGVMADKDIKSIPIEPEKQLIINQWLDAIINQLPGWKKLSRNDSRQLFLQRPGKLLLNEQEIKITVQRQSFDVLLADWPWPLNIAKLPWLASPLHIDWQNI
ncbi:hypothetical protein B5C26_04460 [Photorhabdus luminescens]|uniref:Uncharacterized protein n=1 Tax=Photorhabdus luminescens subsp. mexicana TaxID=2100167 RepID=A0A4R4JHH9_PHOLU|nr:contractile injection system tape measure protein [Photorhabdus luminescens]OWO84289.1 hypothetical protein B5C26_04460 [Photorhabdus luminescens]TDB53538.1 hypothetical protein C5468_07605 [Photorhabdus luminescens subsp. mexicana]